jgi:hypothetical protein
MNIYIFLLIVISVYVLYQYYVEEKSQKDPMVIWLKEQMMLVDPRASQLTFHKNNKSYSINKKRIYLCLEDKYGNYYSKNTLIYVSLHELAHCLNRKDTGHTPTFYAIFNQLLEKATKLKIYNPLIDIPSDYCSY